MFFFKEKFVNYLNPVKCLILDRGYLLKAKCNNNMFLLTYKNKLLDKLKLIYKYFYVFFKLRITNKKIEIVFYDPLSTSKIYREKYLRFFLKNEKDKVFFSSNIKHNLYFNSYKDLLKFINIWILYFFQILKQVCIFNFFSYYKNLDFIINKIYIDLISPKQVYFFNFLDTSSYLSAKILGRNKKINVFYIYTSGILYESCRYDSFENVNIILGSKLQMSEINYYQKKGWMKLKNCNIQIWGIDTIEIVNKFSKEKKYDIGVYSSGEWARPDGFLRGSNIEKIKKYDYCNNKYYEYFEKILNVLEEKEYEKYCIKIYFHPFEKELMLKYKIFPPFFDELQKRKNFVLDLDSNISNFFEAKLGITVFSSITFDRLNYDLDTLFFMPKKREKRFIGLPPRKVLGLYDRYIYSSIDEFRIKLNRFLNV
jgi:hypothetical protein